MVDVSVNGHEKLAQGIKQSVWYEGTDALFQGEGVCYNTDYGTATEADARRGHRVERPTVSNNTAFAGVAVADYSASSTGRAIEIYVPGSKSVPVALAVDTVLDTGLISFTAAGRYNKQATDGLLTEAGRFYTGHYLGRGTAVPRQTVTAVLEASMTGGWLLAADGVTLTVTATAGLVAGDTIVILGGEDDATDVVVPGKYEISSVTSATVFVLTASAYDTGAAGANATGQVTGYAYTGNPTALCDLLDGEESGGCEFISLPNAGGDTHLYMTGGVSYVCGGITLAADAEVELAQGTRPGEKKAFILVGSLTTNDFIVDLVSAGLQLDGSSALAEIATLDDVNDGVYLEFGGAKWQTQDLLVGGTEA